MTTNPFDALFPVASPIAVVEEDEFSVRHLKPNELLYVTGDHLDPNLPHVDDPWLHGPKRTEDANWKRYGNQYMFVPKVGQVLTVDAAALEGTFEGWENKDKNFLLKKLAATGGKTTGTVVEVDGRPQVAWVPSINAFTLVTQTGSVLLDLKGARKNYQCNLMLEQLDIPRPEAIVLYEKTTWRELTKPVEPGTPLYILTGKKCKLILTEEFLSRCDIEGEEDYVEGWRAKLNEGKNKVKADILYPMSDSKVHWVKLSDGRIVFAAEADTQIETTVEYPCGEALYYGPISDFNLKLADWVSEPAGRQWDYEEYSQL